MPPAPPSPSPTPPYHHGNLHRALLDGARAIIAETGRWDFSLREVARRAGVSHNAPYRHFADKDALLAAIGVAGYEALAERSAAAVAGLAAPPALLAALGIAYVEFGIANPALYRLMFGQAFPSGDGLSPALVEAIAAARAGLHGVIRAGALDGSFTLDPDDAAGLRAASVGAWSVVHGLTLLTIDRIVDRDAGPEPDDDLPRRVVEMFVRGMSSRP